MTYALDSYTHASTHESQAFCAEILVVTDDNWTNGGLTSKETKMRTPRRWLKTYSDQRLSRVSLSRTYSPSRCFYNCIKNLVSTFIYYTKMMKQVLIVAALAASASAFAPVSRCVKVPCSCFDFLPVLVEMFVCERRLWEWPWCPRLNEVQIFTSRFGIDIHYPRDVGSSWLLEISFFNVAISIGDAARVV